MLYFDHCASTPPFEEVIEVITEVMKDYYGNPSSLHRMGVDAERLIDKARAVIATALHIKSEQIIFTSGGTESNNLAIKGIAYQYKNRGRHMITTRIEHSSVYECFQQLEKEGYRITYLPVDHSGRVNLNDLKVAICDETILVSVMHVNNEVGSIQPVEQIGSLLKSFPRIQFHVDAVQSISKITVDPVKWGIDLLSISAHKLRGPKGVGLLYRREGLQLYPLIVGGGQEKGLRSGTENVPLIVAMAKAIRMSLSMQKKNSGYLYQLREQLKSFIAGMQELQLNGSEDNEQMAPHIINFSYPGTKSEVFVHALESHGILASTRSACSSGEQQPSRVLEAMGHDYQRAVSGIRISLSAQHTMKDIKFLQDQIKVVVRELKKSIKT